MKTQIKTSISINAPVNEVWNVFTQFDTYPDWNPFVHKLEGNVKVGNQIAVDLPGMKFKPEVMTFEKNREFSWLGNLWFKGLFDGHHKFHFTQMEDGTTRMEHSESFSGILVPLFKNMLNKKTKPGFEQMNHALKIRVEQSV